MHFYLLILFFFSTRAFASTNNSAGDITSLHMMQADWTDTLLKDKKSLLRYAEPILFKTYGKDQILAEKPYVIIFK